MAHGATALTGAIAPGEFIVLYGSNIGPIDLSLQSPLGNSFSATWAQTRVLFDGVPGPVYYAWITQTSVIVPYSVAGKKTVQVQVEYKGVRSNALTVDVTDAAPGIFTQNASGKGPGSILNQDYSRNTSASPAARGSAVMIYATGEGQTNPPGADGLINDLSYPAPVLPVKAFLNGKEVTVLYAGAAPQLVAGVFQVNILIPPDAPSGEVPLVFQVGDKQSRSDVTVSIE